MHSPHSTLQPILFVDSEKYLSSFNIQGTRANIIMRKKSKINGRKKDSKTCTYCESNT